jgi:hypothetical protein
MARYAAHGCMWYIGIMIALTLLGGLAILLFGWK